LPKNHLSDIDINKKSSKLSHNISKQQSTDYAVRKTAFIEMPYSEAITTLRETTPKGLQCPPASRPSSSPQ